MKLIHNHSATVLTFFLGAAFLTVVAFFFVAAPAGFLAAGTFFFFLASAESLYEALTWTSAPVSTPRLRAAFIMCFLMIVCTPKQERVEDWNRVRQSYHSKEKDRAITRDFRHGRRLLQFCTQFDVGTSKSSKWCIDVQTIPSSPTFHAVVPLMVFDRMI
jgi:hypothetical protein